MIDYSTELDLSVRTYNILKRAGITPELGFVLNALQYGINHFMQIKNFKIEDMTEILNSLVRCGYSVEEYIDEYISLLSHSVENNMCDISFWEIYKKQLYPLKNNCTLMQSTLVHNYLTGCGPITSKQLDEHTFIKWESIINELYQLTNSIRLQKWNNSHDLKLIASETDFWVILRTIYNDFIGEVNGFTLDKDSDLVTKTVLFTTYKSELSKRMNLNNVLSFRLNFESLLSRKILEQKRKTKKELTDNKEEIRLLRRFLSKNRKINKQNTKDNLCENRSQTKDSIRQRVTYLDTVYVYKGKTHCHISKHPLKSATAILLSVENKPINLNVEHCSNCNKLYISKTVYENYKKRYGVLIGDIKMDEPQNSSFSDSILSETSPLKLCGYSVSQQEALSPQIRQYIISQVIDLKILTKTEVIHYLEHFINMNGQKTGNEKALAKWKDDLQFTLQYKMSSQSLFRIKSIEKN